MTLDWNSFWFAPGDGLHLGVVRVLFYASMLYFATRSTARSWARVHARAPSFWQPVSFFRLLPSPRSSTALVRVVDAARVCWLLSIAWAASGLLFPLGGIAATVTTLWLLGYENQFGKIHHLHGMLPMISLVLACAPADPLCLGPAFELTDASHGYFWPIQLCRVQLAIVWFAAGIAKLRHGGPRWATSNNLSSLLKLHVMDYYFAPPKVPAFSRWLARRDLLCRVLAVGTLAFELVFPLCLFWQPLGAPFALMAIALIIGFAIAQGPLFMPLIVCLFIFWFPV